MARSLEQLCALEEFDNEIRAVINRFKGQVLVLDIVSSLEIAKFEQLHIVTAAKIKKYGDPNESTN